MQSKISSFFKSSSISGCESSEPDPHPISKQEDDGLATWETTEHQFFNTFTRRAPKIDKNGLNNPLDCRILEKRSSDIALARSDSDQSVEPAVKNKKRSYAQFYLEFGQSDFLLRKCPTCGTRYAPGDEDDEKVHKTFHKNYTHGIPFKVEEVVKMMEIELGSCWISRKNFKVYFFISSQRILGCLFAEPIKEAFKIIPCFLGQKCETTATRKEDRLNSRTLQFGDVRLQTEIVTKVPNRENPKILDPNFNGAILCENESVPAACGIQAIWVTPSNRRKGIAIQLLDAARKSFNPGHVIERRRLAFSQPTLVGHALAAKFAETSSFLVYKGNALEWLERAVHCSFGISIL